jgi:hypothetical protein
VKKKKKRKSKKKKGEAYKKRGGLTREDERGVKRVYTFDFESLDIDLTFLGHHQF